MVSSFCTCYSNNNSEFIHDIYTKQYVNNRTHQNNINFELFNSIHYTLLPLIFCGFPRRKSQYKLDNNLLDNNKHNLNHNNTLNCAYKYINDYSFHYNTVKLEITCNDNNLLYGIYPLRLINWLTTQIKQKLLYKNSVRLDDKYEFFSQVLGSDHPSSKDIDVINQALKALADAKLTIITSKNKYDNISVFSGDVSWLWSDASDWRTTLPITDEFIDLSNKHSCPISKKAQYEFYGSELILFNYFMYQNYCLNESNRSYTYHINQLADILNLPSIGSSNIRNNKYKIIEICNRISQKSGLNLTYQANGITVSPSIDALLVQPLKTIKSATGKVILSQKEINIFTKQYSDLDIARAMYCVQYRINNGMPVESPKRYMWWFLREKEGKAAKSMYKAGLAIKEAQFKKYQNVSKNGDANNPSQHEMINALDITLPDNKPKLTNLSDWQKIDAVEIFKLLSMQVNVYRQYSNESALDYYCFLVWLIVTKQIVPAQLQKEIDALLQIPKVVALATKYEKSVQQLSKLEDLSNYLFGVKYVNHAK